VIYTNRRPGLPEGMTFAEIASEHAAAIVALDRGPVDVLGVSTGGSIAQQLAADRPETVRRLVLASTGCRLSAETRGVQARVAQDVREGKRNEAVAAMALGVAVPGGESLARLLAPLTAPLARRVGDLSDLATTIEAEETFDLARCERAVTAPTLIVAGARDRFYGAELLEETQRLIPGSVLLRIPRRGHMTVMADSRLIEAVRGHLDGGDARRGAEPIAAGR
jgi:pimeloyl-ACP methyl ester carboxylesterase